MREFHATNTGKMIWDGYRLYRLSGTVIRSGCALSGAYGPDVAFKPFMDYPVDTDISHSAGICKLLSLISAHYPRVIAPVELSSYHQLAEIHDMGELDEGDMPDDGTRDKEACEKKRTRMDKRTLI